MTGSVSPQLSQVLAQGQAPQQRDEYLAALLTQATTVARNVNLVSLATLRQSAQAIVKEQTFPSSHEEAWRFTDLSEMLSVPYQATQCPLAASLAACQPLIETLTLPEASGGRLVFIDGFYIPTLSTAADLSAGVWIGPLSAAPQAEFWQPYLAHTQASHKVFTALNTAGFADAALIWLAPDRQVSQPIQVLNLALTDTTLVQPRCLVVASEHSALTLVETFAGTAANFTNSVTELYLEAAANVTHIRLQQAGLEARHIGQTAVSQGRESRYHCTAVNVGGQLSRHHLEVFQQGVQTDTHLLGLDVASGRQVSDTHSLIALSHPHGSVQQLQKNIAAGRAQTIFNGKIFVAKAAQLTNAAQLNRNLLLSNQARVDAKPELDIVADNVKCSHGATVSQLQADELFYLQSRGIEGTQAQQLLIRGFAMEIIEQIVIASVRSRLIQYIAEWI